MSRKPSPFVGIAAALLFWFSASAWAGPPLLCHPFDTGGAPSLPWGKGWNQPDANFDRAQLGTRTLQLLNAEVPIIARMETLRRAAIYASRDGRVLNDLSSRLDARIAAATTPQARMLALFDAGYFDETLEDIVRLQGYDMPRLGRVDVVALRRVASAQDGNARINQALALRPDNAALHFAAALVASADQRSDDQKRHAQRARAGSAQDRLVAQNLDQIASL